jgi:hypothetical protein
MNTGCIAKLLEKFNRQPSCCKKSSNRDIAAFKKFAFVRIRTNRLFIKIIRNVDRLSETFEQCVCSVLLPKIVVSLLKQVALPDQHPLM